MLSSWRICATTGQDKAVGTQLRAFRPLHLIAATWDEDSAGGLFMLAGRQPSESTAKARREENVLGAKCVVHGEFPACC